MEWIADLIVRAPLPSFLAPSGISRAAKFSADSSSNQTGPAAESQRRGGDERHHRRTSYDPPPRKTRDDHRRQRGWWRVPSVVSTEPGPWIASLTWLGCCSRLVDHFIASPGGAGDLDLVAVRSSFQNCKSAVRAALPPSPLTHPNATQEQHKQDCMKHVHSKKNGSSWVLRFVRQQRLIVQKEKKEKLLARRSSEKAEGRVTNPLHFVRIIGIFGIILIL